MEDCWITVTALQVDHRDHVAGFTFLLYQSGRVLKISYSLTKNEGLIGKQGIMS